MNKTALKFFTILCTVILLVAYIPVSYTRADETDDLQSQIDQQNKKLSKTKSELSSAEGKLEDLEGDLKNVKGDLPRLELEIKKLQVEIEYNELQLQLLTDSKKVTELEEKNQKLLQAKLVKFAYQQWKLNSDIQKFMGTNMSELHPLKREYYQSQILIDKAQNIEDIQNELSKLDLELSEFEATKEKLAKQKQEAEAKKKTLEEQIAILNGNISKEASRIRSLQTNQKSIEKSISNLTAQQRDIEEEEARQTNEGNQGNTEVEIDTGEYYFRSYGRDLYQGHGVGLSQFGAYGAARAGMSATQILQNIIPVESRFKLEIQVSQYKVTAP